MADTLFIVPFQMWVYGMVRTTAIRVWLGNRALLLAGLLIEVVTEWLTTEFFGPAISDFAFLSEGLMPTFFMIAVLLLAASYLIAPFFQVRVVDWQKALGWFLLSLLFYQVGPGLYVEGENLRRAISAEFYGQILAQANTASTASGPVSVINTIANGPDDAMGALANQFGAFVPTDSYVDGLDLAMAYTLSTGDDVVYALDPLPEDFSSEYFDPAQGPLFFLTMTPDERGDSINFGLTGISRLLLAFIIILFGLLEQTIYLCLTVAAGILFLSMAIAILFAFFERTEMMARTLVDMWLELFILSVIIAVMQAFVVGLVTVGARTLNPTLTLGASTLGALVMGVLLLKAVGAIWDAFSRLFQVARHAGSPPTVPVSILPNRSMSVEAERQASRLYPEQVRIVHAVGESLVKPRPKLRGLTHPYNLTLPRPLPSSACPSWRYYQTRARRDAINRGGGREALPEHHALFQVDPGFSAERH